MRGLKLLVFGAALFVGFHFLLVAKEHAWFGGEYPPWFMNSMATVRFTLFVFAALGALLSLLRRRGQTIDSALMAGFWLALGASIAMAVTLFTLPGGAGNLFPIVIVFGSAMLAFGTEAGAALGWWIRQRIPR